MYFRRAWEHEASALFRMPEWKVNAVLEKEDQMTWREIKEAVVEAGVKEDEEIALISM